MAHLLREIDLAEPAVVEPLTLAQFKVAARIDGNEFDLVIPTNIAAARRVAEQLACRKFAQRTVRLELTGWPCADQILPVMPVESAVVSYHDGTAWQTLPTAQWALVPLSNGCTVQPMPTANWPSLADMPGARVRIDIHTGPINEAAANVYITAQAAHWTENPSASNDRKREPSPFLEHLLDPLKTYGGS